VLDASGYEELYPTTDAGWAYVRAQAAIVVEAGNMLALPGRAEDNDAWMIYSQGLSDAALRAMDAAAAQDEEEFFQAGAQLYSVCSACHQAYNPDIVNRFVESD
jgi:mono/diheme cytochrome c family protein